CVEAFGEPAVDRREQVAGFAARALIAPQPGEAHGGAQFPELGLLLVSDRQGFAIEFLGGLGMPLPQQKLAFMSIQLGGEPAPPRWRDKPPSRCAEAIFPPLQRLVLP